MENSLVDKTRAACKLCPGQMILKYCRNTTNLTDQERRKHSMRLELTSSECSDTTASIKQISHSGQQALLTLLAARLPQNSSKADTISGLILRLVFEDLCSLSVVQNSGFQNLVHVLEPRYTIPSRQHFLEKALLELYEQKKTGLKSELAEAAALALATDGWTSHAAELYLTTTRNYIDKDWKLQSNVLQVWTFH